MTRTPRRCHKLAGASGDQKSIGHSQLEQRVKYASDTPESLEAVQFNSVVS